MTDITDVSRFALSTLSHRFDQRASGQVDALKISRAGPVPPRLFTIQARHKALYQAADEALGHTLHAPFKASNEAHSLDYIRDTGLFESPIASHVHEIDYFSAPSFSLNDIVV